MQTTEKVTADLSQDELETVLKRRAYERARRQSAEKPFKELTPEEQTNHLRRRGVFNR